MSDQGQAQGGLQDLTAGIVAAYVANNQVRADELPGLLTTVHSALRDVGRPKEQAAEAEKLKRPVSIKASMQQDYLISMEDGRHYKSLKRHLTGRGLTPQQYREKWGLPRDYPMVAPAYAARRSELAKSLGLGRKRTEASQAPAKRGRGSRKKESPAT